ncbi:MAG: thioredoxin domain-containing protein [Salegentibacter sp.]
MKKITSLAFLLLIFSNASATGWFYTLENAQKMALSTNKLIVVDFSATWCGPCKRMESESWNDPEVDKLMANFVPLKIDLDSNPTLARLYEVKAIPFMFIIDGNGTIVSKHLGYLNKAGVIKMLKKYSVNTRFLSRAGIQYYQNQNYVTGIRLGQQYLDYSLFVNEEIKEDFLRVADEYLRKAEDLLDKDQENYISMKQKIELLELTSDLYSGRENRVSRFLSKKIDIEEIVEHNRELYAYLNYCLAAKNEDQETREEWKQRLAALDGGELYLKKSEKFLEVKS